MINRILILLKLQIHSVDDLTFITTGALGDYKMPSPPLVTGS